MQNTSLTPFNETKETSQSNPLKGIEDIVYSLASEKGDEDKLLAIRRSIGSTQIIVSDEDLLRQVSILEFMVKEWIDEFEKRIFIGKTLKELLKPD